MRIDKSSTRRSVVGTIAAVAATLAGPGTVVGLCADETDADRRRERSAGDRNANEIDPEQLEFHEGVVDRIVDGQHVVILLEEDDRVVDQIVVDREELPDVEECDRLLVLLDGGEFVTAVRLESGCGSRTEVVES